MKDIDTAPLQAATVAGASAGTGVQPEDSDTAMFEAAWQNASDSFGGLVEPGSQSASGPSALTAMALRQSEILQQTNAPLDMQQMAGLSVVQAQAFMTNKQIAMSMASANLDVNIALMKTARSSLDSIVNSK